MTTDSFDLELTAALRDYLNDAPTDVKPLELARRIARLTRRPNAISQLFARYRYAWLVVAILVALALLASLLVAQRLLERRPGLLAFQRGGSVYVAEHGSSVRLIAASGGDHDFRLSQWSPDGKYLALADGSTVSVFEDATSALRSVRLPDAEQFVYLSWIAGWSPDSRFIIVRQGSPQGNQLVEVDLVGGGATTLSRERLLSGYVARRTVDCRYNGYQVFVIERSTGEALGVGSVGWLYCGFDGGSKWDWPSWSADSERIVFVADDGSIRTVSPDGSALATVIPADGRGAIYAAGEGLERPIWSPDGKLISYLHDGDLMVVRPDGSEARLLGSRSGRRRAIELDA